MVDGTQTACLYEWLNATQVDVISICSSNASPVTSGKESFKEVLNVPLSLYCWFCRNYCLTYDGDPWMLGAAAVEKNADGTYPVNAYSVAGILVVCHLCIDGRCTGRNKA